MFMMLCFMQVSFESGSSSAIGEQLRRYFQLNNVISRRVKKLRKNNCLLLYTVSANDAAKVVASEWYSACYVLR